MVVLLVLSIAALTMSLSANGIYSTIAGDQDVEQPVQGELRSDPSTEMASIESLQNSFNAVVDAVLPSVVEVDVIQTIVRDIPSFGGFPWFFQSPDQEEYEAESLGSGVIFRREGDTYYVLTNHHVAGDADEIKVVLNDKREFLSTLVGTDSRRDLAVISFESDERDIPIAPLGDSDHLKVGDWVLAMGSPYGYYSSVTAGIVSALGRSGRDINNLNDFIQTDASINQGNSGGPLVNIYGEVIGINTWIAAPTGGNIGLGFAIPINNAKQIISEILEFGRVRDGWLGVSMIDTYEFDAFFEDLGLQDEAGVFVANVYIGSPANIGGLQPGDLITGFNGKTVSNTEELSRLISNAELDAEQTITVQRSGRSLNLTITLDERKPDEEIADSSSLLWPGVLVQPLDDELRSNLNLSTRTKGLVMFFMNGVSENNPFYIAGLRNYDIITAINQTSVRHIADFYESLYDTTKHTYRIEYIRNGETFTTEVKRQVL